MRSADQVDVVLLVEFANDVLSESETHSTVIVTVVFDTTLGVWPEQIAKQASVGYVSGTHDVLDLVQVFKLGTQTAVHAENLLVDKSSNGQAIKHVAENAPESDRVATLALVVEAVDTVDLGTLVISSQQKEVLGILDLVAEQQANCFDRLLSTVDVVTQEQVVGLRREATVLEDSQQVVVLAVNIAYKKGKLNSSDKVISTWGDHVERFQFVSFVIQSRKFTRLKVCS